MSKISILVVGVFVSTVLHGAQEKSHTQEPLGQDLSVSPLMRTEMVISRATALTMRYLMNSCSFAKKYPRITSLVLAVGPWFFPGYRRFVLRQTAWLLRFVRNSFGSWLYSRINRWLVGSLSERVLGSERALQILAKNTDGLLTIQHNQQQGLSDLRNMLNLHQEQFVGMIQTASAIHQEVHDSQEKIDHIETLVQSQGPKLDQIESLAGDTSQQVHAVSTDMEQLKARLAAFEASCAAGHSEILEHITQLNVRIDGLSAEQQRLFADYGIQFGGRFDQLDGQIRVLIEQILFANGSTCAQQARVQQGLSI